MRAAQRQAALRSGERKYFTGTPCKHGHVTHRYAKDGACEECHRIKTRKQSVARGLLPVEKLRRLNSDRSRKGLPVPTRECPALCECCGKSPGDREMCLDHDHPTGAFRGWLCLKCNSSIGKLGDTIAGLEQAIRYLKRSQQ